MRKVIIAGNWKMNNDKTQTRELVGNLIPLVADAICDVVICPPFTDIHRAYKMTLGSPIKVGAQNVSWADSGAFTGEISADMLIDVGAEYVIIGHSERRAMFGETDETVCKRLTQSLKKGLKPIVCVGETLAEREGGMTESVISKQVRGAFSGLTLDEAKKVIIAYEPVWAIGTGKTATKEQANDTIKHVRAVIREMYGNIAEDMPILYGGSMNKNNAAELLSMSDVDGGLIGGASLKAEDFAQIVRAGNDRVEKTNA